MHGFQQVELSWRDQKFVVQPDRVLELVASIEDVLCRGGENSATMALLRPGGPPHVQLCRAYGAALRYAGAQVTDDEIYLTIQSDFANESVDAATVINNAIFNLLAVVSPPVAMRISAVDEPAAKKKKPATKRKRA